MSDGQPIERTNWNPDQPDDSGTGQDYAELVVMGTINGWNDIEEKKTNQEQNPINTVVCEYVPGINF